MPLRNFIIPPEFQAPGLPETVTPDEAPALFEEYGLMPAESVRAMADAAAVNAQEHTLLSPSKLCADTTCRREILIRNFLDYDCDPFVLWEALEGTILHQAFKKSGNLLGGWYRELALPRPEDRTNARLEGKLAEVEGVLAIEVLPGLFMRGTLDRLREDFKVLVDHKSQRWPFTARKDADPYEYLEPSKYGAGNIAEWSPQLNIYSFLAEDVFGERAEQIWVWRTFRGSRKRTKTFRKIPIPLMSRERVLERIADFAYSLRDILAKGQEIRSRGLAAGLDPTPELEALAKATPMDGYVKQLFSGRKCLEFCSCQKQCFQIEGIATF